MYMSSLAVARNFFLFIESTGEITRSLWNFRVELFLAYHRTFGIFLVYSWNTRADSGGFYL